MLCAARASGRAPPSLRRAQRKARSSTVAPSLKGGPFCAPIGGPVWTPIDTPSARTESRPPPQPARRSRRSISGQTSASEARRTGPAPAAPAGRPFDSSASLPCRRAETCQSSQAARSYAALFLGQWRVGSSAGRSPEVARRAPDRTARAMATALPRRGYRLRRPWSSPLAARCIRQLRRRSQAQRRQSRTWKAISRH